MKADSEKIEWLFDNVTQYQISKDTGISQASISRFISGERKLENSTLKVASILTEYADKIKKKQKSES